MPGVDEIHQRVANRIARGISCNAQARIDGTLVSYHPNLIGMGCTHTLSDGKSKHPRLVGKMIDRWVQGKEDCKVSPNTFTLQQLIARAEQYRFGNGPGIDQGDRNPDFASAIEDFARDHADELALRPCP